MVTPLEHLQWWASQPENAALPEDERLQRAITELGLRLVDCPICIGAGCDICGEGFVFRFERGQA